IHPLQRWTSRTRYGKRTGTVEPAARACTLPRSCFGAGKGSTLGQSIGKANTAAASMPSDFIVAATPKGSLTVIHGAKRTTAYSCGRLVLGVVASSAFRTASFTAMAAESLTRSAWCILIHSGQESLTTTTLAKAQAT